VGVHGTGRRRPVLARLERRFRSAFLFLAGVTALAYGTGLLDASRSGKRPPWLPAGPHTITAISPDAWGWIWAGCGLVLLAGCWWKPATRYLFAVAAAVNGGWAVAFLTGYIRYGVPGYWAPAVAFGGYTASILLVSAWPDPPRS
jgi:hypothetical protein